MCIRDSLWVSLFRRIYRRRRKRNTVCRSRTSIRMPSTPGGNHSPQARTLCEGLGLPAGLFCREYILWSFRLTGSSAFSSICLQQKKRSRYCQASFYMEYSLSCFGGYTHWIKAVHWPCRFMERTYSDFLPALWPAGWYGKAAGWRICTFRELEHDSNRIYAQLCTQRQCHGIPDRLSVRCWF